MIFLFRHIPDGWKFCGRFFRTGSVPIAVFLAGLALVVGPVSPAAKAQTSLTGTDLTRTERTANTPSAAKLASGPRFVVVLDAAHGGDDSGAQLGASEAEKTLTLGLSVRLRSLLAARGMSTVTTREGNVNLDSNARAQIANHAGVSSGGAAACLILHASEAGSGVHIYVSSLAPMPSTRFLAWKTAQAAYVNRSLRLAGTVNAALEHTSIGGGGTAAGSGVGSAVGSDSGAIPAVLGRASMPGLDSMTCPAVAIEMAPVRGADRKVVTEVTDQEYQTQMVEALAAALLEWKVDVETGGGKLP